MPTRPRANVRRSARLNPTSISSSSLTPVRISTNSRSRREVFVELAPRPDLRGSLKRRKSQAKASRTRKAPTSPHNPIPKYDHRDAQLAALEAALLAKENQEKTAAFFFLEEQFTCSLCCEILAHPVSVTSQCGHVFCAICILTWIFSKVHDPCGFWHSTASCPNCRVSLCPTPYDRPRSSHTLPIVFNRPVDSAIDSLLKKLASKEKELPSSEHRLQKQDCPGNSEDRLLEISKWLKDGAYDYWTKRRCDGKRELDFLVQSWREMTPDTFREIKHRLQV